MINDIMWNGSVVLDGVEYDSIQSAPTDIQYTTIVLKPKKKTACEVTEDARSGENKSDKHIYQVTVRQYMTKPATPEFDFMARWNNNIPMPLRTMVGEVVKETKGMVYMILHGDIIQEQTRRCMKCGKIITNPVSQYFGMGVECGGHNYVNPFESDEELQEAINVYKKKLQDIKWEGWIIRSAIEKMEEL